jgi:hypothetical protein
MIKIQHLVIMKKVNKFQDNQAWYLFMDFLLIRKHGFLLSKSVLLPDKHEKDFSRFYFQDIPNSYHSILIDLPSHGETVDLKEEDHRMDDVIDKLKLVFNYFYEL